MNKSAQAIRIPPGLESLFVTGSLPFLFADVFHSGSSFLFIFACERILLLAHSMPIMPRFR